MIVGIDEVGRGPLAGPVVACAVQDDPRLGALDWADSKALSPPKRQAFIARFKGLGLAYGLGQCEPAEIDADNILQATFTAMKRAVQALEAQTGQRATYAYVDGNADPGLGIKTETVIKGDAKIPAIGAASILAKEDRDEQMRQLAQDHPAYGFERHSGYGTAVHLQALAEHGACCEHRLSFAPVRKAVVAGRHQRGRAAEELAVGHLEAKGMQVVARNWLGKRGELDIVCDNGLELVIIEVRSRKDAVDPLETLVSRRKWMSICRATDELIYRLRLQERFVRFDVIAVRGEELSWLEDAWRPV